MEQAIFAARTLDLFSFRLESGGVRAGSQLIALRYVVGAVVIIYLLCRTLLLMTSPIITSRTAHIYVSSRCHSLSVPTNTVNLNLKQRINAASAHIYTCMRRLINLRWRKYFDALVYTAPHENVNEIFGFPLKNHVKTQKFRVSSISRFLDDVSLRVFFAPTL